MAKPIETLSAVDRQIIQHQIEQPVASDDAVQAALRAGSANFAIAILGDSTGNAADEWVYGHVQDLVAGFPDWSIDYKLYDAGDGSVDPGAYPASFTRIVQGTGPRVMSVYNCSVPGKRETYVTSGGRDTKRLVPVEPLRAYFSYGYNASDVPADYGPLLDRISISRLLSYYPKTEIVVVCQPAKGSGDADSAASYARSRSVRNLALRRGYKFIDAARAFNDTGNPDGLISGDLVHPSTAGQAVWREAAQAVARPDRPQILAENKAQNRRLFVPAIQFTLLSGTPSFGVVNAVPCWALDQGTDEALVTTFDVPTDWNRVQVYAQWFTALTSGAVVWVPRFGSLSSLLGFESSSAVSVTAFGSTTSNAVPTSNQIRSEVVYDGAASGAANEGRISQGRPVLMTLTRDADAAGDTLAGDAYFAGLMLIQHD